MESSTHQIGVSTVTLAPEGLTIAIARSHWSARHWAWLVQVLTPVLGGGLAWVLAPTARATAAPEAGSPAPRWKPLVIDGLSYLLFVLLIPPGHPLRQLYAAFDWATIDAKCAEVYKNQARGAPAYAPQVARRLVPSLPQAFGNPDAAVGHTRTDGTLCGYRSGLLVDAKRRIIVAVIVVALNCVEAPAALQALDKYYAIFGCYPKRLGLDSAFDRDEVHRYCEAHAIDAGITVRSRPGAEGVFHADAFVWNSQGQLVCPNGAQLAQVKAPDAKGVAVYRACGTCAQCPLLNQCLTAKQQQQRAAPQRALQINPVAHQRAQRSRERSRSPAGRALRRRRFATEGLFGHLNTYHNGDKAPYRSGDVERWKISLCPTMPSVLVKPFWRPSKRWGCRRLSWPSAPANPAKRCRGLSRARRLSLPKWLCNSPSPISANT